MHMHQLLDRRVPKACVRLTYSIAPRRVIKMLWLGNPAIDRIPSAEMRIMRLGTGILAVWIAIRLVRWRISGVPPF